MDNTAGPLDHLKDRDFTIIVDRSGSMGGVVSDKDRRSRWKACQEGVTSIARKLTELDSDGITVYDFANTFQRHDNTTEKEVERIFTNREPDGSTNLAGVLHHAFEDFFTRKKKGQTKANGDLLVCVTDGAPDNEEAVVREIVSLTKKMDNSKELALIFVQVGQDAHASEYLNKLDDSLGNEGAKYDVVSVIGMDKVGERPFTEVLIDAITEAKIH